MNLNSELKPVFREFNIDPASGLFCLMSIYHNIPIRGELEKLLTPVMMQINVAKIVDKDYKTKTLVWNIPLYEGENMEWNWINTEFRPLFAAVSRVKAGSLSSCTRKMKEFFKKHPSVRKQDVIEAAKMYVNSVSDPQYLQQADYFIFKNSDAKSSFSSRLEQYLELIKTNAPQQNSYKMMK